MKELSVVLDQAEVEHAHELGEALFLARKALSDPLFRVRFSKSMGSWHGVYNCPYRAPELGPKFTPDADTELGAVYKAIEEGKS